jgi:hypothetical protein
MQDESIGSPPGTVFATLRKAVGAILRFTRRSVAVVFSILVIWVIIGSIWFPDWWYRFFWNAGLMDFEYWKYGWTYLLDQQTALLIGLCLGVIALAALIRRYGRRLLAGFDGWASPLIIICAFTLLSDALILYKTQGERVEAGNDIERVSATLEAAEADKGWTPPVIETPVDFRYLDKDRVSALYSEVESEFPEKERTVSSEHSGELTLGAAASKAELSGKATQTTSYERQNLSPERKCINLLNALLPRWKVAYYTTVDEWLEHDIEHVRRVLAASTRASADLTADEARMLAGQKDIHGRDMGEPFLKLNEQFMKELSKPEDAKALRMRLLPVAERNLRLKLSGLQGLLIVDGNFRKVSISAQNQIFEATFGSVPRRVAFRFSLDNQQRAEHMDDRSHLRVFGSVVHQLNGGDHIDILPIAIF